MLQPEYGTKKRIKKLKQWKRKEKQTNIDIQDKQDHHSAWPLAK